MNVFGEFYRTLSHWNRKLPRGAKKAKFLATKIVELTSSYWYRGKVSMEKIEDDVLPQFLELNNDIHTKTPLAAIIVPVFIRNKGEADKLHHLTSTIQEQAYENKVVILVDDCSPYPYEVPASFKHLRQSKNKGPATARNKGIDEALALSAEIIAFTDSDCVLHKEWLANIVSAFTSDEFTNALSGNTISYNKCWFGEYQDITGTLNGRKFRYSDHLLYGATCNFAVSRKVAEDIRFTTDFGSAAAEDLEFCFRILKHGFNINFVQDMVVYHDYGYNGSLRNDFPIFWKQFARYGRGDKKLIELIPYYYEYLNTSDEIGSLEISYTGYAH